MKILLKFTHPQLIQYVDEFVSSSEQIWRNLASLAHQWILCSEWDAVRMKVQTADKNITIIHK